MRFLLITGVPGTGKTAIGEYLHDKCRFTHINREVQTWSGSPADFVELLRTEGKDVVITWGFVPGTDDATVRELQRLGFELIWFDGNRDAARKAFLKRDTGSEQLLDIQMQRIQNMNLVSFNPRIIDTFDESGQFLSKEKIVKLILK